MCFHTDISAAISPSKHFHSFHQVADKCLLHHIAVHDLFVNEQVFNLAYLLLYFTHFGLARNFQEIFNVHNSDVAASDEFIVFFEYEHFQVFIVLRKRIVVQLFKLLLVLRGKLFLHKNELLITFTNAFKEAIVMKVFLILFVLF